MNPEELAHLILQLAVLLLVAKLFGLIFKKFKQSEVLGELIGGMAVGPFAFGAVELPWIGKLFPIIEKVGEHASTLPISSELYFFGQIGAVLLLFLVLVLVLLLLLVQVLVLVESLWECLFLSKCYKLHLQLVRNHCLLLFLLNL